MKAIAILGTALFTTLTGAAFAVQPAAAAGQASSPETAATVHPDTPIYVLPPPPAVSVSATIYETGPNVCIDGGHYEPGSDIRFTVSGIPGRASSPYEEQVKVGSGGTATDIIETITNRSNARRKRSRAA